MTYYPSNATIIGRTVEQESLPDLETARAQTEGTLSVSWRDYRAALKVLRAEAERESA